MQTSPASVGLQSDWDCSSGHLLMETNLHGKCLINAGAWIIMSLSPQYRMPVCLLFVTLTQLQETCISGHFCFIPSMQLALWFILKGLFFGKQLCALGTVFQKV